MLPQGTRIALVIESLERGGAQRALIGMANYWAEQGLKITVITLVGAEREIGFVLKPEVSLVQLGVSLSHRCLISKFFKLPRTIAALRVTVEKLSPDVVISFMDETNLLTLCALKNLNYPLIVCERIDPQHSFQKDYDCLGFLQLIGKLSRRRLYTRAARIQVLTKWGRERLDANLREKTVIIPNFVGRIAESPADITLHQPALIAMGRLSQQKRFDRLIKAFARIAPEFPDWQLYIFGKGGLREALARQIRDLGLSNRVHLAGVTESASAVFKQAEIFVLSSDYEGFPNVLIEAMQAGCASLAVNCPTGPNEIIRPGSTGVLVEKGVEPLSAALRELMSDPVKRRELGHGAAAGAKLYAVEQIMPIWEEVITQLFMERKALAGNASFV